MRSLTLPPEACAHRSAISFSRLCQVEPFGASVPSLIVISWAEARGAARARISASASFFTSFSFESRSGEQVLDVVEEEPGPSLREDVREAVILVGVGV